MCLSVGTKKTRISNWTGSTIELHLKNASQETVRVYRVAPNGRKKLRCERARQLCGGCNNLTIWVYNPSDPSHTPLSEPISGDDLEKFAEIKVRQGLMNGSQTMLLLLRIPRVQPLPTNSQSSHHSSRSHSHSSTYSHVSYSSHASADEYPSRSRDSKV